MQEPSQKRHAPAAELAFAKFDAHYVLGTWRNVAIAIWIDETTAAAALQAQYVLQRLSIAYPDGIGLLQIVGEDHPSFDAQARGALRELLRSGRDFIREAPVVYEGTGFPAASLRAVVTGLLANRGYGFPHRVYSSVNEATLAIARRFEKREPTRYARELCEALAFIRDRHSSEFPSAPRSFIRYRG